MKIMQDYSTHPAQRYLLIDFAKKVFNLDLTEWNDKGYWDTGYQPISFLDQGKIVANVNLYYLEMIFAGKPIEIVQFSTVGTLPEYRKKGLSSHLLKEVIRLCKKKPIFLFADYDAVPFYNKLGFEFQEEYKYYTKFSNSERKEGLVRLNPEDKNHLNLIYDAAGKRTSISDEIGVLNPKLIMFHALYTLRNNIFRIPQLDTIIFYRKHQNRLIIYDIIGADVPDFSEILPYIMDNEISTAEFMFCPDKLNIPKIQTEVFTDNQLHFYNFLQLENRKFIFPFTSHA